MDAHALLDNAAEAHVLLAEAERLLSDMRVHRRAPAVHGGAQHPRQQLAEARWRLARVRTLLG